MTTAIEQRAGRPLTDLRPGEHPLCLYEDDRARMELLAVLLRKGLQQREKVLCVIDDAGQAELLDALGETDASVAAAVKSGQLSFLSPAATARPQEEPDPQALLSAYETAAFRTNAQGFTAFRAIAVMDPFIPVFGDGRKLVTFEAALHTAPFAPKSLLIGLYRKPSPAPALLLEAVKAHALIALDGVLFENPFRLPPAVFLSVNRAEAEVAHLLQTFNAAPREPEPEPAPHPPSDEPAGRRLQAVTLGYAALLHGRDEHSLLPEICRILVETGGYRFAWIGRAEPDSARTVTPMAQAGFEPDFLDTLQVTWAETGPGSGPMGAAIRTGQPFTARRIPDDPACAPWRAQAERRGYAAVACLPLLADGRALGALALYATEPDAFDAAETGLLQSFCNDLAYSITALQGRAVHARAEAQLQLRAQALHAAGRPIAFTDLDGVILDANPAFWRAVGCDHAEASGQTLAALAGRPEEAADLLRRVRENGQARGPFQALGKNGAPVDLAVEVAAIRDEMGTPLRALFSFRARSDVLTGMSHELHTPLNAVIGFSELLLQPSSDPLTPHQRECVSHILESGVALQRLVDAALDRTEKPDGEPAPGAPASDGTGPGSDPREANPAPDEAAVPESSRTILLIEDNALNMKLTAASLERAGYTVVWAASAEDGLSVAEQTAPGLILMDIGLPGMDGLEATRRLKQNPATKAIPVIALTANDRDEDRRQAAAAGCAAFIAKPIRVKSFLTTIGSFLPAGETRASVCPVECG